MNSLLIKKNEARVVSSRLKGIPAKLTNMDAELYVEEFSKAPDRHIAIVTLSEDRTITTNHGICEELWNYFQISFTREPVLTLAHFKTYLANFPCFEVN